MQRVASPVLKIIFEGKTVFVREPRIAYGGHGCCVRCSNIREWCHSRLLVCIMDLLDLISVVEIDRVS